MSLVNSTINSFHLLTVCIVFSGTMLVRLWEEGLQFRYSSNTLSPMSEYEMLSAKGLPLVSEGQTTATTALIVT